MFIKEGHSVDTVTQYSLLSRSSWYFSQRINIDDKRKLNKGRPVPGFSINPNQTIVMDSTVVEALRRYRERTEFVNGGGYHKLVHYLRRDYGFHINHKKLYRLCLENNLLLPRAKKKRRRYGKVCVNRIITGPKQLWEFDIKYGYIHGENRYFFCLFYIDIFIRKIVGYHIGLSCKAGDLSFTLKEALKNEGIDPLDNNLVIRSDNGSQMTSNHFRDYISSVSFDHEFIPARDCNKNAHIESFNSIFETEFLQVWYFANYEQAYVETVNFVSFYNSKRIHGSLNNLTPQEVGIGYSMGIDMGIKEIRL